jgi:4a-hydroxytetrahydrobiopterin dehydratase
MGLSELTCKPPKAGETPLSIAQATTMLGEVHDWSLKSGAITREFQFKDFGEAMIFVNKVAELAQAQQHHPDILINYKTVKLTLTTHKINGLSQNDFIMAAKINQLSVFAMPGTNQSSGGS